MNNLHDPSRRLPPDEKGRPRFIDKRCNNLVWVRVGKGHPLARRNGWMRGEHRLKAFEAGIDIKGKFITKDGSVFETFAKAYQYTRPRKQHFCRCGCGAKVDARYDRYLPGHRKTKNHAFAHLPVSRERKRQLRRISEGKCIRACNEPIFANDFCKKHFFEERAKRVKNTSRHTKWACYLRGEKWVPIRELQAAQRAQRIAQRAEVRLWRKALRREPDYVI